MQYRARAMICIKINAEKAAICHRSISWNASRSLIDQKLKSSGSAQEPSKREKLAFEQCTVERNRYFRVPYSRAGFRRAK